MYKGIKSIKDFTLGRVIFADNHTSINCGTLKLNSSISHDISIMLLKRFKPLTIKPKTCLLSIVSRIANI